VTASGDDLIIKGDRKEEKEEKTKHTHRIERRCGSFERIIPVPKAINQEKISQRVYRRGVHSAFSEEARSKVEGDTNYHQVNGFGQAVHPGLGRAAGLHDILKFAHDGLNSLINLR
jgi:hypothetical protein